LKNLFNKNLSPSCLYCLNGRKDKTKEVFCIKKLKYIKDQTACRKYQYNPYERVPLIKKRLKKYKEEDFLIDF
jgi:hypothetical protein